MILTSRKYRRKGGAFHGRTGLPEAWSWLAVVCVPLFILMAACGRSADVGSTQYQEFVSDCESQGGKVTEVRAEYNIVRTSCIIDGAVVATADFYED